MCHSQKYTFTISLEEKFYASDIFLKATSWLYMIITLKNYFEISLCKQTYEPTMKCPLNTATNQPTQTWIGITICHMYICQSHGGAKQKLSTVRIQYTPLQISLAGVKCIISLLLKHTEIRRFSLLLKFDCLTLRSCPCTLFKSAFTFLS